MDVYTQIRDAGMAAMLEKARELGVGHIVRYSEIRPGAIVALLLESPTSEAETIVMVNIHGATRQAKINAGFSPLKGATESDHQAFRKLR